MEDLINKKGIDKLCLEIYTEDPFCSITGICFIQDEDTYFGIEQRVEQLDKIIDVILLRLNEIEDSSKENIIKIIHEKKNQLNEIRVKFREAKKQYLENDKYYRKELFEFYLRKYQFADIFAFAEKKKYMAIMIEVQKILNAKFIEFRDEYVNLINSLCKINNYILKIKNLFNIII
jgi:hypothetical protein